MILKKKSKCLIDVEEGNWHFPFAWLPTRVNNKEVQWFKKIARKKWYHPSGRPYINTDTTWIDDEYIYADAAELMKAKLAVKEWAEYSSEVEEQSEEGAYSNVFGIKQGPPLTSPFDKFSELQKIYDEAHAKEVEKIHMENILNTMVVEEDDSDYQKKIKGS